MHVVNATLKYGSCCMTGEMAGYASRHFNNNRAGFQYKTTLAWLQDYYGKIIGDQLEKYDTVHSGDTFYAKGATEEEAWGRLLHALQEDANRCTYKGVQVRTFWFVDYNRDGVRFEAEALRQLVAKREGTVHMGVHKNSNTRNLLDCYMAVFKNEPRENDDYEEEYDED